MSPSESKAHGPSAMQPEHVAQPDDTKQPGTGPSASWLDVLDRAAGCGLIDPTAASSLQARAAIGLLTLEALQNETARLLADGPAAGRALESTTLAFNPGDVIELRALDPAEKSAARHLSGRLDVPDEREALCGFVREHIGRNNLYFGINPRKAEMAGTTRPGNGFDVIARRMVVLDLDLKDAPDADPDWSRTRAALRVMGPLLELDSGNGFHFWFRIEDAEGADLPASVGPLAAAMARLGADNMADPPRITRLPYTVNLPTETKRKRGAVVRLAVPVQE